MPVSCVLSLLPAMIGALIAFGSVRAEVDHTRSDLSETLDDARIEVAIKDKLSRVSRKSFASIDVSVSEGVVTLTGTAESLWIQQQAREHSQLIRGVRGVIDRLSVGPLESVSDFLLREHLEHLFLEDPVVEQDEIRVDVHLGRVTLEGQVHSWEEKRTAVNVAKMVKGVREVRDALHVQAVRGRADSDIRTEILRRLQFDVWVESPSLLQVEVRDGQVTLKGPVGSLYEKNRVAGLAWVEGVQEVNAGDLTVDSKPRDPMRRSHRPTPSDRDIAGAIHLVLSHDPRVSRFAIHVSVAEGIATLTGTVPFLSIRREAEQDAGDTVGVRSVKNHIAVHPESTLSDLDVRNRLVEAWSRDPVLAKFDLEASVRKGTALLSGRVDSLYERNHAENVSSRIRGVTSLVNEIVFSAPETEKTDWEMQLDIENQVWWSPFLSGQDIVATVQDGRATLTGSVQHVHHRLIAEQQAFEAGASEVINRLRVGTKFETKREIGEE